MNKSIFLAILVIQGAVLSAQAASSTYFDLYDKAATWQDKAALLLEIRQGNIAGSLDFYAGAFDELVMIYRNIKHGSIEWVSANNIAKALITELVAGGRTESGDNLWRGYQVFTDSVLQAECLKALGSLKINSHFADVERVITTLNAKVNTTNRQSDENIAMGAFISLEKYGNPQGYLSAFAGSEGWYREYVKQQARKTLAALLSDPSQLFKDVIQSSYYSNALKLHALQYINASRLDVTQKADIASRSLVLGWRFHTNNQRIQRELSEFRRLALEMMQRYGSNSSYAVYQAAQRSLYDGALDEKLDSIQALGNLRTRESSKILFDYAVMLNYNRRQNNSQSIDDRLMRSLIPAIAKSGDSGARDVLYGVKEEHWSNTVIAMAQEALSKL